MADVEAFYQGGQLLAISFAPAVTPTRGRWLNSEIIKLFTKCIDVN